MPSFLGLGDGTSVSTVVDLGGRRREVDRFPLVRRRYAVPCVSVRLRARVSPHVIPDGLFQRKNIIHSVIVGVNSRKVLGFGPLFFEVRVRSTAKSHS